MNGVDKVIASAVAMTHLTFSLRTFRSDYKSQIYDNKTVQLITHEIKSPQ